ncbi:Glutamate--tRNA ligase [Candidatus Hodgkinia cicadicola]|nr:Glutamate--tRNA ligase [Candidatus Hodgkinia cicadicola]
MSCLARVRLAPSPTGCPHLGNLLIGVYNLLFKLKHGASIILRIEDTDASRSQNDNVGKIYKAFGAINIIFDESSINVNKFGPYIQTQRRHIHAYYCSWLINNKLAFWCKCKWRRVDALKRVNLKLGCASIYDGKCLKSKLSKRADLKLRLKAPRAGLFYKNKHSLRWSNSEMQTLWTAGGPTFHIANVIDDHLMRISHVLRGRDWVSSLAKQFLLYVYLRFKLPRFYHLPLLICSKGTKLSKRLLNCGVEACVSLGILPKAILAYFMCLIVNVETFKLREVVAKFNINDINKSCLRINKDKLLALNKRVLTQVCLKPSLFEYLLGDKVNEAFKLCKKKSVLFTDVYRQMLFVFCFNVPQPPPPHISRCYTILAVLINNYKRLQVWNKTSLTALHLKLNKRLGLSLRTLFVLIYLFAFNTRDSISLYDSFVLLGKECLLFRLELALNKL